MHLDLYSDNQEGEVERLVKLGATRYPWRYLPDDDFVVLADPDDNLFCVVQVPSDPAQWQLARTNRQVCLFSPVLLGPAKHSDLGVVPGIAPAAKIGHQVRIDLGVEG